jgi:hypothetical protein
MVRAASFSPSDNDSSCTQQDRLEALDCQPLTLEKELGETRVLGGNELDRPTWHRPSR